MERKVNDFLVDSIGHCFLCLSKIVSDHFSASTVYSFQYISYFLKISRRHVFDEKLPVPLTLLEKVEKSLMKVSLCDICGAVADKLSEQIQQLERIRMEVNDGVNRVKSKLVGALRSVAEYGFEGLAEGSSIEMEKVNIVQRLRAETAKKCSLKLERAQPRVKLKAVASEKCQLKLEATVGRRNEDDTTLFLPIELPEPETQNNDLQNPSSDFKSVFLNHETDENEFHNNFNSNNNSCLLCKAVFTSFRNFKRHFEGVHLRLRFTCDICSDSFTQRHPLMSHLRLVHPQRYKKYMKKERKHGNFQKGKTIGEWNDVPLTYKTSESEFRENYLNNTCRLCNLAYQDFFNFKRHYESIHLKLRFTCDICSAAYSDRPNLRRHLHDRHPEHQENTGKRIKMEVTKKRIALTDRTCVPLNYPTDENKLLVNFNGKACLMCNKVFSTFSNFKDHFEAIHLKLRFACDLCKLGYSTRKKLKKHLILHHIKHYREHFEKESRVRNYVRRPIRGVIPNRTPVPLNYKPSESEILPNYANNICLLCNKPFSRVSDFKKHFESIHLRLHFTCDVCNRGFSQRSHLRMHLLTNHPQRYQEYQSARAELKIKTELVEMPV